MRALRNVPPFPFFPSPYQKALCRPLIAAVVKGRADIVQFLFLQGASIWPDDMANRTALHHAAALGDAQVFDLLLDYGASSDPPKGVDSFKAAVVSYYLDKDGHTILDCTLQNKSLDPFLSLVWQGLKKTIVIYDYLFIPGERRRRTVS